MPSSLTLVGQRRSTDRLESGDLAGLGRDIVHEDTTLRLGAELVIELEPVGKKSK